MELTVLDGGDCGIIIERPKEMYIIRSNGFRGKIWDI